MCLYQQSRAREAPSECFYAPFRRSSTTLMTGYNPKDYIKKEDKQTYGVTFDDDDDDDGDGYDYDEDE